MARQPTKRGSASRGRSSTRTASSRSSTASSRAASGRGGSASRSKAASTRKSKSAAGAQARQTRRSEGQGKDLGDLFLETLKDVYHAEKQLVRALPKMARAAQSPELRQAFEKHLGETKGHADRLVRIFQMSGKRPQTKPCHGMMGLVEEGEEVIKEFKGSEAIDAGLIAAAQAVEHYEISRYGTLKSWAERHGMREVAALIDQTLAEEKRTDETLTRIAEKDANRRAA